MTNPLRRALGSHPLLGAVVYTGAGVLPLFLISTQILQLDEEIGFGVARLGLATFAFFGSAALAANLSGRVVASMGSGQSVRVGSFMTFAACVLAGSAVAWWLVPIAAVVAGIANGMIQVASNVAIFDGVSDRHQGLGFGAKQAAVPAASVLAGVSLPFIGLALGWRWVFVGAALLALGLAVSAPGSSAGASKARVEPRIGRPPRRLVLLAVGGFCGAMAGNGLSLFIVPSAVDVGITEGSAGLLLAGCSLLVVLSRLGSGWLVDRNRSSGLIEMAAMAGSGALGALVLAATTSRAMFLVAMPIAVIGAWGWPGIFFFAVVHSFPEFPARASGIVLSGNLTGTLVGPLIVGLLAGRGHYPSAWVFAGAMSALASLAFVIAIRDRRGSPVVVPGVG